MTLRAFVNHAGFVCSALLFLILSTSAAMAQDERKPFDVDSIAQTGSKVANFVPAGWQIEEDVKGDLNGDGVADHALKIIEKRTAPKDEMQDRNRVLILLLTTNEGLRNAAVADKLLQCTACGGAFYGVVDAPANVTIQKGVLIINQDHGSREVTETTLRFRYDEQPDMFILIGYDYASRDRAAGGVWTESTNYLTGKRVTTIDKGKRPTTKTTVVAKDRLSITEVDAEQLDADATHRLGLD